MGLVTIQVWDATGNKRQDVEVPDDAPVNRILAVLLEKMNRTDEAAEMRRTADKLRRTVDSQGDG